MPVGVMWPAFTGVETLCGFAQAYLGGETWIREPWPVPWRTRCVEFVHDPGHHAFYVRCVERGVGQHRWEPPQLLLGFHGVRPCPLGAAPDWRVISGLPEGR